MINFNDQLQLYSLISSIQLQSWGQLWCQLQGTQFLWKSKIKSLELLFEGMRVYTKFNYTICQGLLATSVPLADQTVELPVAVLPNNIVRPDLQGSHTGTLITLIGSGPTVAGRTGNYEHFVVRVRLVPRNMSTKTGSGMKYKYPFQVVVLPEVLLRSTTTTPG